MSVEYHRARKLLKTKRITSKILRKQLDEAPTGQRGTVWVSKGQLQLIKFIKPTVSKWHFENLIVHFQRMIGNQFIILKTT